MNTINFLQKNLSHALFWNSFEAIFYQAVLFTHQCVLFWYIDKTLYGLQGALFATVYLSITFLNGAFDTALSAIFHDLKSNKALFKTVAFTRLLQQTVILFMGGLIGFTFATHSGFLPFLTNYKNPFWILLISIFIASEGTKKNIRALLHLGFKNKETASIESSNILLYIASIWIFYFFGVPFSLELLTIPFVIVSLITNYILFKTLWHYYQTIPIEPEFDKTVLLVLKKTRLFLYTNELMKSAFSSNFLMPFFASILGLQQAGTASFINSITHSMTFFIQKIFGSSSAALFANSKQIDYSNKQELFSYLNRKCMTVLGSLLLLFTLTSPSVFSLKFGTSLAYSWPLIYCFFIAHLLENMFIIYEKFFITHNKAHYITACNTISFISCAFLITFTAHYSLITTLLFCITARFTAFISLTFLAHKNANYSS